MLLERLLGLGEPSRVLHRDHGLVGKPGGQLNLFVGERLHPASSQIDCTDRLALAHERDCDVTAVAQLSSHGTALGKLLGLGLNIQHVHWLLVQHATSVHRAARQRDHITNWRSFLAVTVNYLQGAAHDAQDCYAIGVTERCQIFAHNIQHRSKLAGRL